MAEQVAAAYPDVLVAVRAQRAFLARAVHFADLRATAAIVDRAAGVLDFGQPVAVMLLGILQGIPDQEDPSACRYTGGGQEPGPGQRPQPRYLRRGRTETIT